MCGRVREKPVCMHYLKALLIRCVILQDSEAVNSFVMLHVTSFVRGASVRLRCLSGFDCGA